MSNILKAASLIATAVLPFASEANAVTFGVTGSVVNFVAPVSGAYDIKAEGAEGGAAYYSCYHCSSPGGGLGARVDSVFHLDAGAVLDIVVGGEGGFGSSSYVPPFPTDTSRLGGAGGGGGGGSFVQLERASGDLLLEAAGGGGGAAYQGSGDGGESGTAGGGAGSVPGGDNGNGGGTLSTYFEAPAFAQGFYPGGGGGGGYLGSGGTDLFGSGVGGAGASNGYGGGRPSPFGDNGAGGFGGGGGGSLYGGGGGGGYSGGAGGGATYLHMGFDIFFVGGGGGGSYSLDSQSPISGDVRYGDGEVTIDYVPPIVVPPSPSAVPEPAAWAMMLIGFGVVGGAMRRRGRAKTLVLALALGGAASQASATTYTVTDLGVLPGNTSSFAFGVNDDGQVTGGSVGPAESAFFWSGAMSDYGVGSQSVGRAINASAEIAGYYSSGGPERAFTETNHVVQLLGTLGGSSSFAYGLNDAGQVTGSAALNATDSHAFFYDGTMHDLGTLGGRQSVGDGINDAGQIVGSSYTSGYPTDSAHAHAFIYTGGQMQDFGTLGGNYSIATAINAGGLVTGSSSLPGNDSHAVLWSGGGVTDLGSLGGANSYGYALDAAADVVGASEIVGGGQHAFLYSNGAMADLNQDIDPSSGWSLQFAAGINTLGQIVGGGFVGGAEHAFLLTPYSPPPPPGVPEPAAWAMMLVGFAVVGGAMRRRQPLRTAA